jgi:hypothetical protein
LKKQKVNIKLIDQSDRLQGYPHLERHPYWVLPLNEVATSGLDRVGCNANTLDSHRLSVNARNLHINSIRSKAARVLEEVVWLPGGSLPCLSTVGRDLELGDADVRVADLHREPELGGTLLVLELNGRGDATGDEVPADGDYSGVGVELGIGVGEKVEVVSAAAGTLIDNLVQLAYVCLKKRG